jgi:drug/metabolite transporter (DMT)-like permease
MDVNETVGHAAPTPHRSLINGAPMTTTPRGRLTTAEGSRPEAFGPTEWGLLLFVAVVWGASPLFIAESLESLSPAVITTVRLALGAAALTLVPASRRRVAREDWLQIFALAVFWMAIPFSLFPIAQQWISSATAGMLNGAMPIFSATVAALLLRRLPGRHQAVGLVIGFVGVAAISLASGDTGGSATLGIVLILVALACYGLSVNLAVPLQQRYGSLPVLWRALLVATALTAPFSVAGGMPSDVTTTSWVSLLTLGILGTGFAFVAMGTLAGRTGGTRAASATYFLPIVAIVLGVLLRGDQVTPAAIVGVVLVLIGAALVTRREVIRAKPAIAPPPSAGEPPVVTGAAAPAPVPSTTL